MKKILMICLAMFIVFETHTVAKDEIHIAFSREMKLDFQELSVKEEVEEVTVPKQYEYYQIDLDTVIMLEYEELTVKASAYCKEPYKHTCNDGNFAQTATMTTPTVGRTIAVDPCVISLGTMVDIDGRKYIAEDTGGAIKGNKIDILFETHDEALNFGVREIKIKVYE